jgi:hypothetical protein
MDPDPDPGVPKTCGSGGSGLGSATLPGRRSSRPPTAPRPTPGPQWTAGEILAKYIKFRKSHKRDRTVCNVPKAVLGYENCWIPRLNVEDPQLALDQCGPGFGILGQCGSGSSSGFRLQGYDDQKLKSFTSWKINYSVFFKSKIAKHLSLGLHIRHQARNGPQARFWPNIKSFVILTNGTGTEQYAMQCT